MSRPTSLASHGSDDRLSSSYIHPILDPLNGSLPAPNTPFMSHSCSNLDNSSSVKYELSLTPAGSHEATPSQSLPQSPVVTTPGTPQGSPKIFVKIVKKLDPGVHMSPKLKRKLDLEAAELRKQLGNVTNEVRNVTNDVLQHTTHAGKVIIATTGDAGKVIKKQTEEAGKVIYDQAKQGIKILNEPIEIVEFGWFDVLVGTISVGTFYFDVISDSLVAFYMYHDPDIQQWFLPTLLVLIIPLFVVNMFSLYWYWFDEFYYNKSSNEAKKYTMPRSSRTVWALRILGHLLLHAHVFRYVDIMYYGRKSKRDKEVVITKLSKRNSEYDNGGYEAPDQATMQYSENMTQNSSDDDVEPRKEAFSRLSPLEEMKIWIHAERDSCNVDILSSLLQDAPQLILQLHILSFTLPKQAETGDISTTLIMQLLSVCGSLIAMAWSVTSFRRSVRMSEPTMGNLSPAGLITLTLTHFCSIAPQVLCFALFMTRFLWPFLITVFGHWLLMTTLVFAQMTCFSHYIDPVRIRATFSHDINSGPFAGLDDLFFSMTFGMILLFTFVDIGFPHARIQGFIFHSFRIMEEAIMLSLWFMNTPDSWYHILPPIVAAGLAVAGVLFLAIYIYQVNPDSPKTSTVSEEAGYQNGGINGSTHPEEVYQISTVSGKMTHDQA